MGFLYHFFMIRNTKTFIVKVPKREMAYFNFLLESHEGLGISRTIDPTEGILEVYVPEELEETFVEFLEGLKDEMELHWSKP